MEPIDPIESDLEPAAAGELEPVDPAIPADVPDLQNASAGVKSANETVADQQMYKVQKARQDYLLRTRGALARRTIFKNEEEAEAHEHIEEGGEEDVESGAEKENEHEEVEAEERTTESVQALEKEHEVGKAERGEAPEVPEAAEGHEPAEKAERAEKETEVEKKEKGEKEPEEVEKSEKEEESEKEVEEPEEKETETPEVEEAEKEEGAEKAEEPEIEHELEKAEVPEKEKEVEAPEPEKHEIEKPEEAGKEEAGEPIEHPEGGEKEVEKGESKEVEASEVEKEGVEASEPTEASEKAEAPEKEKGAEVEAKETPELEGKENVEVEPAEKEEATEINGDAESEGIEKVAEEVGAEEHKVEEVEEEVKEVDAKEETESEREEVTEYEAVIEKQEEETVERIEDARREAAEGKEVEESEGIEDVQSASAADNDEQEKEDEEGEEEGKKHKKKEVSTFTQKQKSTIPSSDTVGKLTSSTNEPIKSDVLSVKNTTLSSDYPKGFYVAGLFGIVKRLNEIEKWNVTKIIDEITKQEALCEQLLLKEIPDGIAMQHSKTESVKVVSYADLPFGAMEVTIGPSLSSISLGEGIGQTGEDRRAARASVRFSQRFLSEQLRDKKDLKSMAQVHLEALRHADREVRSNIPGITSGNTALCLMSIVGDHLVAASLGSPQLYLIRGTICYTLTGNPEGSREQLLSKGSIGGGVHVGADLRNLRLIAVKLEKGDRVVPCTHHIDQILDLSKERTVAITQLVDDYCAASDPDAFLKDKRAGTALAVLLF